MNLLLTAIFLQVEDGLELPALEHGDSMIAVAIILAHNIRHRQSQHDQKHIFQGQLEE